MFDLGSTNAITEYFSHKVIHVQKGKFYSILNEWGILFLEFYDKY
jgi:hypothetical protein